MRQQTARFADFDGRHPDFGDEVGRQQFGQGERIYLVGLHPRAGDEFHQARIGNQRLADPRRDLVVEVPGVGGGLHHQRIGRFQVRLRPARPGVQLNAPRREHHFLPGIDAAHLT